MEGIGAFRSFRRTRLYIEPYFLLKPTKVGFIFTVPYSSSRAEDLAAVNRQSWGEDWVLKSGLRNYDSSRNFLIAGSGSGKLPFFPLYPDLSLVVAEEDGVDSSPIQGFDQI